MKRTLLLLTVAFSVTACTSLKRTAYHQKVAPTPIIQGPLIADIEADPTKKITSTYDSFEGTEEGARNAVLYAAMENHGCDVILNPVYEFVIGKKHIDATVKGICGKYTQLRKPTLEDITILQELEPAMPMFDPNIKVVKKGLFSK